MPPESTPQSKEQYEALGRFVEAFEAMVQRARITCLMIQTEGLDRWRTALIGVPLYHQAFTAKPIFESFRAVLMEALKREDFCKARDIEKSDIPIFSGVLSTISKEYNDLANTRNNLLHGVWGIEFEKSEHLSADEFALVKFAASGEGMKVLTLPKSSGELLALRDRCLKTEEWILNLYSCVYFNDEKKPLPIKKFFKKDNNSWTCLMSEGAGTLP